LLSERGGGEPYQDLNLKTALGKYVHDIPCQLHDEPASGSADDADGEAETVPAMLSAEAGQMLDGLAHDILTRMITTTCETTARAQRQQIQLMDVYATLDQFAEPELAGPIRERINDVIATYAKASEKKISSVKY